MAYVSRKDVATSDLMRAAQKKRPPITVPNSRMYGKPPAQAPAPAGPMQAFALGGYVYPHNMRNDYSKRGKCSM